MEDSIISNKKPSLLTRLRLQQRQKRLQEPKLSEMEQLLRYKKDYEAVIEERTRKVEEMLNSKSEGKLVFVDAIAKAHSQRAYQMRKKVIAECKQRYYDTHREERKAYSREYYKTHLEERKARMREYHKAHREELIAKDKERRRKAKEAKEIEKAKEQQND